MYDVICPQATILIGKYNVVFRFFETYVYWYENLGGYTWKDITLPKVLYKITEEQIEKYLMLQ
jgi:hypothetical protein